MILSILKGAICLSGITGLIFAIIVLATGIAPMGEYIPLMAKISAGLFLLAVVIIGNVLNAMFVPSIKAKTSNNRIERFHGTEKERTKVMRGFDNQQGCASLMEGFRVHYNLVKNHQALGCTPSEATGNTNLNGFKWLQIIQNSMKNY